jgi:hypothetical protein
LSNRLLHLLCKTRAGGHDDWYCSSVDCAAGDPQHIMLPSCGRLWVQASCVEVWSRRH